MGLLGMEDSGNVCGLQSLSVETWGDPSIGTLSGALDKVLDIGEKPPNFR